MKTIPTSDVVDSDDLRAQMIDEPVLLDVRYYFPLSIETLDRTLPVQESFSEPVSKFKQFQRLRKATKSEFLSFIETKSERSDPDLFGGFLEYSDFLLQLPAGELDLKHLKKLQNLFIELWESPSENSLETQNLFTFLGPALLNPINRWGKLPSATKAHKIEFEERFLKYSTALNRKITEHIADTAAVSRLLHWKNNIVFIIVTIDRLLGLGIHPTLFSYHAILVRKIPYYLWNLIPAALRLEFAALCLHLSLFHFPPQEKFQPKSGFSIETLADFKRILEGALESAAHHSRLSHVAVIKHTLEKLNADAFTGPFDAIWESEFPVLSEGEHWLAADLVARFSSYRNPVTIDRLAYFLAQFKTASRIRACLRLLQAMKFMPLWKLTECLEALLAADGYDKSKPIVVAPLGDIGGSTAIVNYLMSHSTLPAVRFAASVSEALSLTEPGDTIRFVDDCILSGTQTLNVFGDLLGTRNLKPHHTKYCAPLEPAQIEQLKQRHLDLNFCVAIDGACQFVEGELSKLGLEKLKINVAKIEPANEKTFESTSSVGWITAAERDDLKSFAVDVGMQLLTPRAHEKNWPDGRLRESALGFSDNQRLLVFPYSVPKSTLTLLWAKGNETFRWIPLFENAD